MKMKNLKKGVALIFALVFSTILLQLAIVYTGMLRNTGGQTVKIDDQIKENFYADALMDLAILKFNMFPGDFYAAFDAASSSMAAPDSSYLTYFVEDPVLKLSGDTYASSSFNTTAMSVEIASITLLTRSKWNREALRVQAIVDYTDSLKKNHRKTVEKTVQITRTLVKP